MARIGTNLIPVRFEESFGLNKGEERELVLMCGKGRLVVKVRRPGFRAE